MTTESTRCEGEAARDPAWLYLLAGWLWASTHVLSPSARDSGVHAPDTAGRDSGVLARDLARRDRGVLARDHHMVDPIGSSARWFRSRADGREAVPALHANESNASQRADDALDRMGPRALRRLPGIGQTRALAIAHDRWERGRGGGLAALEGVFGIGPATVRQIRAWFDAQERTP